MQPSIGRIVHYVSHGTPGGEYTQECRAAIITELTSDPNHPNQVGLAVLNPTGIHLNRAVPYNNGDGQPGHPSCPDAQSHGQPFRYCGCGWTEPTPVGGTWHWPERT
ncbi:hypothetical protein C7C46_08875 [Streptomyces tateyamensis]|uniref:Uncharacterized protein n=1 Tax=Streptomyces tateyamensis TaxID=565073 RepID=A0A2V4NQG5_9ACTN|nr:hypothetical protein [Streptomyces tateyamensis]PYC83438.1 hypothetical protein C7C46_08875 [Streptomyces tateyamensis]